jgi:hypothetical protein
MIDLGGPHSAARDAVAIAKLLVAQLKTVRSRGIRTFGDLSRAASGGYAFVASLDRPLLPAPPAIQRSGIQRPRGATVGTKRRANIAEYLDALLDATSDLRLDDAERDELRAMPARLGLIESEVRAVHAKIFWGMLGRYVEDSRIDTAEAAHLARMHELLAKLGWAPGDALASAANASPPGA